MEEEQTQIKSVLIWFPGKYLPLLLLLQMKCLGSILHSHLGEIPPRYYETFSRRMLMMNKTKKGTWFWNKIIRWLKEDRGHTNGWLHFCRLPFPPFVYEALVINQPFRPQFRSLGSQTKVPPVPTPLDFYRNHPPCMLIIILLPEFFQNSRPPTIFPTSVNSSLAVGQSSGPRHPQMCNSPESQTNAPTHLGSGNLPPKSSVKLAPADVQNVIGKNHFWSRSRPLSLSWSLSFRAGGGGIGKGRGGSSSGQ